MGLDAWLYDNNNNEIIYWRKENHFHKFFCENGKLTPRTKDWVGPYVISRDILTDLFKRIDTILAAKLNKPITKTFSNGYSVEKNGKRTEHFVELDVEYDDKLAKKLLPTQSGFFFGSTEYTPWYFKSLIEAKDVISDYLIKHPRAQKFIYDSYW